MLDWVIYKSFEIFKVKLRWSKSSRLLQRVAFLFSIILYIILYSQNNRKNFLEISMTNMSLFKYNKIFIH